MDSFPLKIKITERVKSILEFERNMRIDIQPVSEWCCSVNGSTHGLLRNASNAEAHLFRVVGVWAEEVPVDKYTIELLKQRVAWILEDMYLEALNRSDSL